MQLYRAMVRTQDVGADGSCPRVRQQILCYQEIVDAPADVPGAGVV
jgi:hypothetical protein